MVTHIIFVYKQKQMVPHNLRRKKSETEREREREVLGLERKGSRGFQVS